MSVRRILRAAKLRFASGGVTELLRSAPPFLFRRYILIPYFYPENRVLRQSELHTLAQSDGRYWQYEENSTTCVSPVVSSPKLPWNFRQWERTYEEDPSYVYELPNCRLVGKEALGFTEDGDVILNLARDHHHSLLVRATNCITDSDSGAVDNVKYVFPSATEPDRTLSAAFQMVADPNNYYTWLTENLPKLKGVEKYHKETGIRPTIVLHPDAPSYVQESLNFLGFDSYEKFKPTSGVLSVEKLVVCTHRRHNAGGKYNPHRNGYDWLREKAEEKVSEQEDSKRLYISRHDVCMRHALNEDEVIEALENRGFEKVTPGNLSFEEQVQKFANAEIIAGIHGAGFSNMVWADGPQIIEVIPESKIENMQGPTYYCLARALNYDYDFVFAKGGESGVEIDVESLCGVVDNAIGN